MSTAPSVSVPVSALLADRLDKVSRLARSLVSLQWLTYRWPSEPDEPLTERRVACLERLCSDDASERPKVLLVMAHADDETAWAGSRLLYLGDHIELVFVTDNAPRNEVAIKAAGFSSRVAYAEVRRAERDAALATAGIRPEQVRDLDIVDQEVKFHLPDLRDRIATLVHELAPDIVLTHAYEGGNADHDAIAYAVHAAVRARRDSQKAAPVIIECGGYHRRFGRSVAWRFLPSRGCEWRTLRLTGDTRARKRAMYACYRSQETFLRYLRDDIEVFRCAPRYDFRKPPNWEDVLLPDQAVASDPRRTLPADAVHRAEASAAWVAPDESVGRLPAPAQHRQQAR
jgi:LmbE family N-acetylglucosaminyl deacetylase